MIKDLTLSSFANDHSLKKAFSLHQTNDEHNTIATIEKTMLEVKSWMDAVCLKLNESKTEFIYFGSQQLLQMCNAENVKVINETITRSVKVKYIGGTLNSSLQFKTNITNNGKAAMLNLIWIRNIRKYIDKDTCHTLVRSLALSHLDYCNSILTGLPKKSINAMQCIQNIGVKMILNKKPRDSTTECLKELHWLPIQQRIDFRILVLVFKSLKKQAPKYLQELIVRKEQRREGLRSGTNITC